MAHDVAPIKQAEASESSEKNKNDQVSDEVQAQFSHIDQPITLGKRKHSQTM